MDDDPTERVAILMLLHATCEKALQSFARGATDADVMPHLTRIVEHAKRELDALAEERRL